MMVMAIMLPHHQILVLAEITSFLNMEVLVTHIMELVSTYPLVLLLILEQKMLLLQVV